MAGLARGGLVRRFFVALVMLATLGGGSAGGAAPTVRAIDTASVEGIVTFADGSPAVNVQLLLCGGPDECQNTDTDETGHYSFAADLDHEYELLVQAPHPAGGYRLVATFTLTGAGAVHDVALGGGTVFGAVSGLDAGATHWVGACGPRDEEGNQLPLYACVSVAVDGNDSYEIGYLPDGVHQLSLHFDFGARRVGQVSAAGAPVQFDFGAPSAVLEGYVMFEDGTPVTEAYVEACEWSACYLDFALDAEGYYEITHLPASDYTVAAHGIETTLYGTAPGVTLSDGQRVQQNLTVSSEPPGGDTPDDPPAPPTSFVFGYVTGTDGEPAVSAQVEVCDAETCVDWTYTDETGYYRTNSLAEGDYTLNVTPDNWLPPRFLLPASRQVQFAGDVQQEDFVLDPAPTTTVRGQVSLADGTLLEGAPVAVCFLGFACSAPAPGWDPGGGFSGGLTDANGDYVIEDVPMLGPDVPWAARDPDHGANVIFAAQPLVEVETVRNLQLPNHLPGGVDGTFHYIDNDGAPVEGATLSWDRWDDDDGYWAGGGFVRPTAADGSFTIRGLAPGDYLISANKDGRRARAEVTVGSEIVPLALSVYAQPPGGVFGYVRDGNGTPLAGIQVDVFWSGDEIGSAGSISSQSDGSFEMRLDPGMLFMRAYAPDFDFDEWQGITATANLAIGTTMIEHDLVLHGYFDTGARISGTVVDEDSEPVGGGRVRACSETLCRGTAAAGNGSFLLRVPAGTYTLTLYAPNSDYFTTSVPDPVVVEQADVDAEATVDAGEVTIRQARPLPAEGTTLSGDGVSATPGSVPSVLASQPLTLTTQACPGGAASYSVTSASDPSKVVQGVMTETPAGTYSATFTLTFGGAATIEVAVDCPGDEPDESVAFDIYIDPSGYVRNTLGEPVVGAMVTLQRAPTADGPWATVPDGSTIMSPSNRTNPDFTDSTGHFGWDVIEGFYRVLVEKDGCVDAADRERDVFISPVYPVPPEWTDLDLRLWCGEDDTPAYQPSGPFAPLSAFPSLNRVTAGAAVPVKFSLGGDFGTSVLASGFPRSQTVACSLTAEVAGVEPAVAANSGGLQHDSQTDVYTFIWKTDAAWADSCRQLVLEFDDGSALRANFQFPKKGK